MSNEEEKIGASIFAVRTTAGQEKNAADMVEIRVKLGDLPIMAILAPEVIRGYIFIEAVGPHVVEEATTGIKHIRSRVPGIIELSEVERYLVTKPVIEQLGVGYIIEIISGPFKGMKAKITRVNVVRNEVTLELLEATFTLPITVHADYVKVIKRADSMKQVGE